MLATISSSVGAPQFGAGQGIGLPKPPADIIAGDRPDLGAARGICIGTVEECRRAKLRPGHFDLLVRFALDSAELTPQARANLAEVAKALADQKLATARFVIEGYTDASGGDAYNIDLSERRARAVTSFLVENGIAPDRVEVVGRGKADPRSIDPFDPVNRRVEMHIRLQ
jgi:outer membrane protein OmpA-like peptidoglycan-associated protein